MEKCTSSSTCLLALLLLFSVQGLAVVARVRLSSNQYTVLEGEQQWCIEVINDEYGPDTTDFTVTYSYSTVLGGGSGSTVRTDQLFFESDFDRTEICVDFEDDEIPCEGDITGTVSLTGSPLVAIGEPRSATVTIQDDDFLNASFTDVFYNLMEGRSNDDKQPSINTSIARAVMLEVSQESTNVRQGMMGRSLLYETMPVSLENTPEEINLDIQDDDIGLEDPEEYVLMLSISPEESACSNVQFTPLRSTRILINDDDRVRVGLMSSSGTVAEGEDLSICVTLSRRIARQLDVRLYIRSGTADLGDLAESTDLTTILTFTSSETMKCMLISAIQDHVIESTESLRVELSVMTNLPAAIQHNLQLGTSSTTITIQDTSMCTNIHLDPLNTNSIRYVHKTRSLCFSCPSCEREISWDVISYQGHRWTGRNGEHSSLSLRAEVLENGTLVILNSSLAFSQNQLGTVSFENQANVSSVYNIYIHEDVEVSVSCMIVEKETTVTCLYEGSPEPQIAWFADSQRVPDGDIKAPEGEAILVVNSAAANSMYTCRASNSFGSRNSTVVISKTFCNSVNNSALSTSKAISSLPASFYLISCIISLISHYM